MKALITGGAGFIGSHLAGTLYGIGVSVVVLDKLSLGDRSNLEWSRAVAGLEFVECVALR